MAAERTGENPQMPIDLVRPPIFSKIQKDYQPPAQDIREANVPLVNSKINKFIGIFSKIPQWRNNWTQPMPTSRRFSLDVKFSYANSDYKVKYKSFNPDDARGARYLVVEKVDSLTGPEQNVDGTFLPDRGPFVKEKIIFMVSKGGRGRTSMASHSLKISDRFFAPRVNIDSAESIRKIDAFAGSLFHLMVKAEKEKKSAENHIKLDTTAGMRWEESKKPNVFDLLITKSKKRLWEKWRDTRIWIQNPAFRERQSRRKRETKQWQKRLNEMAKTQVLPE